MVGAVRLLFHLATSALLTIRIGAVGPVPIHPAPPAADLIQGRGAAAAEVTPVRGIVAARIQDLGTVADPIPVHGTVVVRIQARGKVSDEVST